MPIKLTCLSRSSKTELCQLELENDATVGDLKAAFHKAKGYYPQRQKWSIDPSPESKKENKDEVSVSQKEQKSSLKVLDKDSDTLVSYGLSTETPNEVLYKDLGLQISWRLVFVYEYLGPMLITLMLYGKNKYDNGWSEYQYSLVQRLAAALMIAHFGKRVLETLFVHRFSHASMPIKRLPINCFHYWILCGVGIGYFVFNPNYSNNISNHLALCLALAMCVFEFLNYQTHIVLRNLRPRNSTERRIPYGWGFDYISCANYFWEIMSWLCFCLIVRTLTAWLFLAVAVGQMSEWAIKKHRNYRREFDTYPKKRWAMIPFIL